MKKAPEKTAETVGRGKENEKTGPYLRGRSAGGGLWGVTPLGGRAGVPPSLFRPGGLKCGDLLFQCAPEKDTHRPGRCGPADRRAGRACAGGRISAYSHRGAEL